LHRAGNLTAAVDRYRELVVDEKYEPTARHFLGLIESQLGNLTRAEDLVCQSVCLVPADALFLSNLGLIYERSARLSRALKLCGRAVVLHDASAEVYFNGAVVFSCYGSDYSAATRLYQKAIALAPEQTTSYLNLASCLMADGHILPAIKSFARTESLRPGDADVTFSSALASLTMGDFEGGWCRYESRWAATQLHVQLLAATKKIRAGRPPFSGFAPDRRRRILVWAEQGVGDEVMFGGLLGEFRGLCGQMLLQVDRRLVGLFERALPGVRVYERGQTVPTELYDEQIPMGSLGKWLRPSRESFAGKGGRYLQAQAGMGRRLREELGVCAAEKLIGLSWRSASAETGAARSVTLKELVGALQGVRGVRFLNLQYGEVSEEIAALGKESGVQVLSHPGIDNREDLEGLAGLIEGCDLVVSVGNATAHLSGALGQRTWVLLPYVAGWRWLHEGERCPWYQSVRLYRQAQRGRWDSVLAKIGRELT